MLLTKRPRLITSFKMKNICVFCASSERVSPHYKEQARELARVLSGNGIALVYGGARIGLMGAIADKMLEQGAEVIGVIPEHLKDKEVAHEGLTELHVTDTMQERQKKMADLADGFIILPGGLGTLAELFEVLTWKSLNLHRKPIYVLNINGYWDHLLSLLEQMGEEGFLYDEITDLFEVIESAEVFADQLLTYKAS